MHVVELAGLDHVAVHAAKAHGLAAHGLDVAHEALAHLAGQHHLHDVGGLAVGHAQAVDEFGLLSEAFEKVGDLRAAAVHQHDLHAHEREQQQIAHHGALQILVDHGVAAVFDDDDLLIVCFDIGQGLNEDLCPLVDGHGFLLMHQVR